MSHEENIKTIPKVNPTKGLPRHLQVFRLKGGIGPWSTTSLIWPLPVVILDKGYPILIPYSPDSVALCLGLLFWASTGLSDPRFELPSHTFKK